MVKLESFKAVKYRGIDGLEVPRLSRVNLITGANGAGKTALIEAMWLFTGRFNPGLLWNVNIRRTRESAVNPITRLTAGALELSGSENGEHHDVKFVFEGINGASQNGRPLSVAREDLSKLPPIVGFIRTTLDNKFVKDESEGIHIEPSSGTVLYQIPQASAGRSNSIIEGTSFQETSAEFLHRYSNLVREGLKKELVTAANLVASGIEDFEILAGHIENSYLYATISGHPPRPLHDLGGGAVKLVRLLLGCFSARNGILFWDELENGIHYSAQQKIWATVRQWTDQWNVQLVATTHSDEFIDGAIDAFKDHPSDLAIHRIYKDGKTERPRAATFTDQALLGVRSLDLEIR